MKIEKYYVFLDESGVDKRQGKSVVVLLYISSENIGAFENAIFSAEKDIGVLCFHWAHSTWRMREYFVKQVSKNDFGVKIAFVSNPFTGNVHYERVLDVLVTEKDIVSIIIDGRKGRSYGRKLKNALRNKGIRVRKLRSAKDGAYPALRAADAIAGIMKRKNDDPSDERIKRMYDVFSKKIIMVWEE